MFICAIEKVNDRGKAPILNLLNAIGRFPIIEGKNWDESQWDNETWKKTVLKFRKYVSKQDDDIFSSNKETNNLIDTVSSNELYFNQK